MAQRVTVTGTVTDNTGTPLPGVSVLEMGTTNGTITNLEGSYTIQASPESTLQFSFVGFESQEVVVGDQTIINISLAEGMIGLDEVIVVGYGQLVVKDLTSSISTVKAEELDNTPSAQVMQALQGKVAGVQVVSAGGPGDAPTIRVRGTGSYLGSGESPLYVVDGMFFDNIDFLNMSEVETVSVLKDASAAAIYGVRAANGVIIIETKSGAYNQKAEFTYDGYYGTQVAQNVLKMANAEQFTAMAMESGSAADSTFILNAMQRYGRSRINPDVPDVNTDWYKEILRPAQIQNHSVTVTGGSENARYSIGTSYFSQDGILDMKNSYERFNVRSNIDYKANDWITIGGNMIWSNASKYEEESGAWNQAYFAVPILPVYDDLNTDATPINFSSAQLIGYRGGQNPFPALTFNDNFLKIRKALANFYLKFDLIQDKLSFKTTYNTSYTNVNSRYVDLPYYITDGFQRTDASITKSASTYLNQIWDNVLTYQDQFGSHFLTAMVGSSYRDESYDGLSATGYNFPYEYTESWYLNFAETIGTETVNDGGLREYGLSYFGRLNYNYNGKYLLYGTLRADGTSKYQEKWGYFPTVGLGWVLSEEDFLSNIGAINFLKVRASWGKLGNDKLPASSGARTTSVITTAIDDLLVSGTKVSNTFAYLGWEVVEEWNIGLTSRFMDSRLSFEADYFSRDTKNAVIPVKIPGVGETVLRNVGIIRNSGIEFSVNWSNQLSEDLSYTFGANLSTLKNEVIDLYGQPYIDAGTAEFRQRSIEGEPLLAFYGREVLGVYQNWDEINADSVAIVNGLEPGDFIYKDQDGDGDVDDDDRVVLGSYLPKLSYGFNFNINYKGLGLSANFFGQYGNKILNRKRGELIWTADGNLDADLAINRWHGEGTSDKYPSSAGLRKGWNQKMSDYFVEDGSFFRIQNVQLSYNIPAKQMLGEKMPLMNVVLTAERPLTLFKYNGFNPEVANGWDTQTYPIPAVYTVGLKLTF